MSLLRELYANRWVRYLLTALLLGLVVVAIHPTRLSAAVGAVQLEYVLVALALTVPFLALKVLRWHLMLRSAGIEVRFGEAAVSLIGGMGLALVTPARLGELVRVAYLRDSQKLKIGGLVMIDKGLDVLVLSGLAVAGAWELLGPVAGGLLTLVTLVGLVIVYNPRPLSRALHRISAHLPLQARLEQVWSSLDSLAPGPTTVFLVLTLLAFAVVLVQFSFILLNWRSWSPELVILTFPLVILTNVLPITVGGLGVREGAAVLLLGHFGVTAADAALAAFLMFVINTALPGIVGALILPAAPRGTTARTVHSLDRP